MSNFSAKTVEDMTVLVPMPGSHAGLGIIVLQDLLMELQHGKASHEHTIAMIEKALGHMQTPAAPFPVTMVTEAEEKPRAKVSDVNAIKVIKALRKRKGLLWDTWEAFQNYKPLGPWQKTPTGDGWCRMDVSVEEQARVLLVKTNAGDFLVTMGDAQERFKTWEEAMEWADARLATEYLLCD